MFTSSLKHVLEGSDFIEGEDIVFDVVKEMEMVEYKELKQPHQVLYYTVIVPHSFIGFGTNDEFDSYSYTLNSNATPVSRDESKI